MCSIWNKCLRRCYHRGDLRCFVTGQFCHKFTFFHSVKFSWLKMWMCKNLQISGMSVWRTLLEMLEFFLELPKKTALPSDCLVMKDCCTKWQHWNPAIILKPWRLKEYLQSRRDALDDSSMMPTGVRRLAFICFWGCDQGGTSVIAVHRTCSHYYPFFPDWGNAAYPVFDLNSI